MLKILFFFVSDCIRRSRVELVLLAADRLVTLVLTLREKELETEEKFNELAREYPESTAVLSMYAHVSALSCSLSFSNHQTLMPFAQFLADIKFDEVSANRVDMMCENAGSHDESQRLADERRERADQLEETGKVKPVHRVFFSVSFAQDDRFDRPWLQQPIEACRVCFPH